MILRPSPDRIELLSRLDQAEPRAANWCAFLSRSGWWVFPTKSERARA